MGLCRQGVKLKLASSGGANPGPEGRALGIFGEDHKVAFIDALCMQGGETRGDESPTKAASALGGRDGEVVNQPAPTVMAHEDGAGEATVRFGDEAGAGIAGEEGKKRGGFVCGREADTRGRLRKRAGGGDVCRQEGTDGHLPIFKKAPRMPSASRRGRRGEKQSTTSGLMEKAAEVSQGGPEIRLLKQAQP